MDMNSRLVCDPSGKPILFERLGDVNRCVALVEEYLGYRLTTDERIDDGCFGLIPSSKVHQYALSIPERASIAALAWNCREYGIGLKQGETITMPVVTAFDDTDCFFQDEGRAYMFAKVVETTFELEAQVVGTLHGWNVVVGCPDTPLDGEVLAQLRGACLVLMDYPVGDYDYTSCGCEVHPDDDAREAWHIRKNAQAQRIEDGINAILSRLGHPATQDIADSIATGAELVENIEAIARPGGRSGGVGKIAGKKSSAKRSA